MTIASEPATPEHQHHYVLLAEADAACRFEKGATILINLDTPEYKGELSFSTRQVSFGDSLPPMPGPIDARAELFSTLDLMKIGSSVGSLIRSIMSTISVASNAVVGLAEPTFLAEVTEGIVPRPVFQALSKLPSRKAPQKGSVVDPAASLALVQAANIESQTGAYLSRAIEYYAIGLQYLTPDTMALAVMHLFIAAENLKLLAIQRCGIAVDELAERQRMAMKLEPFRDEKDKRRAAENYCRDQFVFHGDHNAHRSAISISDGIEHGFANFGEVKALAGECALAVAHHVRHAIVELANLGPQHAARLCDSKYDTPFASYPTVHIFADILEPATANNKWDQPFDLEAIVVSSAVVDPETGAITATLQANAKAKTNATNIRFGASS